jgi:ribosome-binding protein aMBF1 (putative translation factor)
MSWFIKGITDAATTCEICGRLELKRTVHLVTEDGAEIYAGTTCAARKVGATTARMNAAVKAYRNRLEAARCDFPDYFRNTMNMTVEQYLSTFPQHRKVPQGMYRRYMAKAGFTV